MEDTFGTAWPGLITFGPFCLSPGERMLTRDGIPIEIGGRSFDLLAALLAEPGRVLSKRDLLRRIWPDVIVDDGSLRFHMAGLRKILRDGEDGARYIATQVGVGYAFVAPVHRLAVRQDGALLESPGGQDHEVERTMTGGLPARLSRVIGREQDVQLLTDRITETQVFTIVGPAGVGKTTLAIEIGYRLQPGFAQKVSFVDLGTLEDPALISSAIAGALGIRVQANDPMAVILSHVRAQQWLLILDNCEHVIDAVSNIVERIGDAAPNFRILATSREPLRVRGEHVHWLGSLDFPAKTAGLGLDQLLAYPAVELFVERARANNSRLAMDLEAARLVAEMCRRLDGMALPIELTAVRAAAHGLEATAKLLGERFSLSWAGRRTAQPRQQTLQATLDWSYGLLSDTERRVLERLSVFVGPFGIDAALEVGSDEAINADSTAAALDQLTAKSLVSPDRAGGANSYRLLEMTRAYAKERLRARGLEELHATARRHASYFLRELEAAGSPQGSIVGGGEQFSLQLGNIRGALEWSFGPDGGISIGVPLAAAGAPVFLELSLLVECRSWCARAVAHLEDRFQGTAIEQELQAALGLSLMFTQGNTEAVETALRRALDVAVALGDRWNQLRLLGRLHIYHERIGDLSSAHAYAKMAVEVADAIGEPEAVGVAASLAGISYHLGGDQPRARRELELSLRQTLPSERCRTIHYGFDHRNRSGIALARTLWLLGHADQATRVAEQTVSEAARLEHPVTHCIALLWTLSVYFWTGDLEKASDSLDTFARLAELNVFGPYTAASGGLRGELMVQRGATEDVIDLIRDNLARLRSARYELLTTSFTIALARALALQGQLEEADSVMGLAIDRCRSSGDLFELPELLRVKAQLAGGDAEMWLLASLECSRQQSALGWELRAAIDLARLRMSQHRSGEALALLRPLRAAFSEGFGTIDLCEADKLLAELSGADHEGALAELAVS